MGDHHAGHDGLAGAGLGDQHHQVAIDQHRHRSGLIVAATLRDAGAEVVVEV